MTSTVPFLFSGHQSIPRTLRSRLCYSLGNTVRHKSSDSKTASPLKRQTMAPKKGARGKFAKPIKTQIKRTHFVCFPLTTEESISQLKDSLARFRQVTSILEDAAQDSSSSTQWQRSQRENHQSAPGLPEPPSDSSTKDLRQIPSAAYRPPGTFHLTLGVMDLSAHEDMERAIHLLEDINYTDLLRGAETTTTAAPGQQGQDVKTTPRGLSSRHLNVGIAETTPWSSEGGAPSTSGGEGNNQ